MKKIDCILFDLDGVVLDTESQYDAFWENAGKKYKPGVENFAKKIKGTTLPDLLKKHFSDLSQVELKQLIAEIELLEKNMELREMPNALLLARSLKEAGYKIGIVTSSTESKMAKVNAALHLDDLFLTIVTSADVNRGKPNPDCYLLGAERLNSNPENCIVFEDSLSGINAASSAGMIVVGLATTLPKEDLVKQGKCNAIINGFEDLTIDKLLKLIN